MRISSVELEHVTMMRDHQAYVQSLTEHSCFARGKIARYSARGIISVDRQECKIDLKWIQDINDVFIQQRITTMVDHPFSKLHDKSHEFTPALIVTFDRVVSCRYSVVSESLDGDFFPVV